MTDIKRRQTESKKKIQRARGEAPPSAPGSRDRNSPAGRRLAKLRERGKKGKSP